MMTLQETSSDLRRLGLRQTARYLVACQQGCSCGTLSVPICSNEDGEESYSTLVYLFKHLPGPESCKLIGLAGSVAECLEENRDVTAGEIRSRLANGPLELSESDKKFTGKYTAKDVDRCAKLVRKLWPQIEGLRSADSRGARG